MADVVSLPGAGKFVAQGLIHLQETPLPERKARKSVAFSDGTTLIDENGEMTNSNGMGEKASATSHTRGAS